MVVHSRAWELRKGEGGGSSVEFVLRLVLRRFPFFFLRFCGMVGYAYAYVYDTVLSGVVWFFIFVSFLYCIVLHDMAWAMHGSHEATRINMGLYRGIAELSLVGSAGLDWVNRRISFYLS